MRLILKITAIISLVIGLGLATTVVMLLIQHVSISNLYGFLIGGLSLLTLAYFCDKKARSIRAI